MSLPKKLRYPFVNKQHRKIVAGKCQICHEDDYSLLDVHRINHGKKYSISNTVVLCCSCHRKHHSGKIQILSWNHSTIGRVLYWIDENGNEHFS